MLKKSEIENILTVALSRGGWFAEVFIENTTNNRIALVNGKVDKASGGIVQGIGLRVFNGNNAIYSYTNDFDINKLMQLAKNTADVIATTPEITTINCVNKEIENKHKYIIVPNSISKKDAVPYLKEAHESAVNFSKQITETSGVYMDKVQNVLIANSDGLFVTDTRINSRINITSIASNGDDKQSGFYGPGALCGFELFDNIDCKEIGRTTAEAAVTMVNAEYCKSGRMPVVINNGFGGVLFHEACGHSLEATGVAVGSSVFTGKLGQKIASDKVTAIDDGTRPNNWGSLNIDDEGTPTQKNILIENGVLKSYLVDKLNGKRMGMPSTGSGRRESYKYAPTSRMNNTYIDNGTDKTEEIIANTEFGLFAKELGGGSVQPATGEFNFSVREGFMIRNGKIAEPVRGATLIGKGQDVLLDIDMVGDNMLQEQGVCGSVSGSVFTNVGQPLLRVKQLTVGGR